MQRLLFSLFALSAGVQSVILPQAEAAASAQNSKFGVYTAYPQEPTDASRPQTAAETSPVIAQIPRTHVARQFAAAAATPYWYEQISHQGRAAFNGNSQYKVYRNVRDYGAKGDGVSDDTAAIQNAINDGNRCGVAGSCASTTITPAVVYFPSGTYLISRSILDYYYTQLIGNPNNPPVLKATAGFVGLGVIDGDQYIQGNPAGVLSYGSTNVFWRQIRNFVIDLTSVAVDSSITGIHWPTAQATSIQNVVFNMARGANPQQQGIYVESGSGGIMVDLTFNGGNYGMTLGNQQFTMRNLVFNNQNVAINQIWDWGWTYKSITINNCNIGLDMSNGGPSNQAVGSVIFIDSSITNTKIAFNVAKTSTSRPATGGSLSIENIKIQNVPTVVQGPSSAVYLAGTSGSQTIAAWKTGNYYNPTGPNAKQSTWAPPSRPTDLAPNGRYLEKSKPQYASHPPSDFLSVRNAGARGDGTTDDTSALQYAINSASSAGKILFVDAGTYRVIKTIFIPPNTKIVGESYSVIMSSGSFFNNVNSPQPVVQVGNSGDTGVVEWSDMIVSTQGGQAGAILIKWNLASWPYAISGMWDVHTRIGGFAGSNLQVSQCPPTDPSIAPRPNCVAAYMSMWIAKTASNLLLENVWLWTADHDVEDPNLSQISVYTGRGLYVESQTGNIWLYGTSVEHHALYQYQFSNTRNIFMGQIQTETPYWQPHFKAMAAFAPNRAISDPDFAGYYCPSGSPTTCGMAFGLRITASNNIFVYGAGLYSFFNNYSTACVPQNVGSKCQTVIFTYDSAQSYQLFIYNLNTVGSASMIQRDLSSLASNNENFNNFPSTIVLFRSA